MPRLTIHPREIRDGDTLVTNGNYGWVAIQDARSGPNGDGAYGVIRCNVRYPDGGIGTREWDSFDNDLRIEVQR